MNPQPIEQNRFESSRYGDLNDSACVARHPAPYPAREEFVETPIMSTTSRAASLGLKFHPDAYRFVDAALRHTQRNLGRISESVEEEPTEDIAHISGSELLDGIRELATKEFGMMALAVFHHWGVFSTDDFGRIVFDFIERGAMRKTDRDQMSDFYEVYDFEQVFDREYDIDLTHVFQS